MANSRKKTVTNSVGKRKASGKGRANKYATATNRSTKVEGDYVEFRPRSTGMEVQGDSVGYDPKDIWEVDQKNNPALQMREALKSGFVSFSEGGKPIKAKVAGVKFSVVEHSTRMRIFKEATLEEAKKVFFDGKDAEVFGSEFKEAITTRNNQIKEAMKARASSSGVDKDGHEVLTEDSSFSLGDGLFGPNNPDAPFIPLGNGPLNQQLYIHDYWDMVAKAFQAYHHNPYAHRAIEIIINFVLGRGFSINFKEPIIQDEWDQEVDRLKIYENIYIWLRDLERTGNLYLRPIFDPFTGSLIEIQNLEASTILEVITDPLDMNKVHGYYQQYMTPIQIYGSGADRQTHFVVNTFTAEEIVHVKVNNTGSEKVGRSTLFPGFEYLKMLRDYHVASANKAIANACLIFDWSIMGSPTDVQTFASSIPPINYTKPIASVYHSDNAKLQSVSGGGGNSSSGRTDPALSALINAVAVAVGIAKEYLGETSQGSRSNSLVSTEPSTKSFQQRQKVIQYHIFEPLIARWKRAKRAAGVLPTTRLASTGDKFHIALHAIRKADVNTALKALSTVVSGQQVEVPIDDTVDITFPEIVKGDLAQMIENYAFMQSMGWWSPERAAHLATQEFGTVRDYNYYTEQQNIQKIGIKPIAAKVGQSLMCDLQHPPQFWMGKGGSNSQDTPAPQSHQPARSSNKNDFWNNVRNHPVGAGAAQIRKAAESLRTHFGSLTRGDR